MFNCLLIDADVKIWKKKIQICSSESLDLHSNMEKASRFHLNGNTRVLRPQIQKLQWHTVSSLLGPPVI